MLMPGPTSEDKLRRVVERFKAGKSLLLPIVCELCGSTEHKLLKCFLDADKILIFMADCAGCGSHETIELPLPNLMKRCPSNNGVKKTSATTLVQ